MARILIFLIAILVVIYLVVQIVTGIASFIGGTGSNIGGTGSNPDSDGIHHPVTINDPGEYKFTLSQERIYYLGEPIDQVRFIEILDEAKQKEQASVFEYDETVSGKFVDNILEQVRQVEVKYSIIRRS